MPALFKQVEFLAIASGPGRSKASSSSSAAGRERPLYVDSWQNVLEFIEPVRASFLLQLTERPPLKPEHATGPDQGAAAESLFR